MDKPTVVRERVGDPGLVDDIEVVALRKDRR
jgi:hypothetical protein